MLVIGIAGGSGSGKTTVVKAIVNQLQGRVVVIPQDSYYKDSSHVPPEERTNNETEVLHDVLGLEDEAGESGSGQLVDGLIGMIVDVRKQAKAAKDWATSDHIRDELKALGVQIKDTKDGCEWTIE